MHPSKTRIGTRVLLSSVLMASTLIVSTPVYAQGFNFPQQNMQLNNFSLILPGRTGGGGTTSPVGPRTNLAPTPVTMPTPMVSPVSSAPSMNLVSPPPSSAPTNNFSINVPLFKQPPNVWIPINLKVPKRPKTGKNDGHPSTAAKEPVGEQTPTTAITVPPQPVAALPGIFTFSMDCGGGLCNQNNEFEMIPGRGTLYSLDSANSVNLARGHMVIIADKVSVNLKAGHVNLRVNPGASVAAEVDPDGTTRIYSLASYEKNHPAAFMLSDYESGGGHEVPIKEGEELVFSGKALQDEELIAADGLAIDPVEGGLTLADRNSGRLHLFNYSTKRMSENEFLIGCRRVSVPPTERLEKLHSELARQTSSSAEKPSALQTPDNTLKPVSSTTAIRNPNTIKVIADTKTMRLIADEKALVEVLDQSTIELTNGSLLLRTAQPVSVKLPDQYINVQKGAVVLIKVRDRWSKITNLSDMATDSVSVTAQGKTLKLGPAREAVFSKDAPSLGTVFDVYKIGHRSIASQDLPSTGWITTSEVALLDELMYQPLLQSYRASTGITNAREAINQVLKTAAILQMLRGRSSYTRGEIEDETNGYIVVAHSACQRCSH